MVNDYYRNNKSDIHAIGHSPPILHSTVVQTFFIPDYGGYYQASVKLCNWGLQLDYDNQQDILWIIWIKYKK